VYKELSPNLDTMLNSQQSFMTEDEINLFLQRADELDDESDSEYCVQMSQDDDKLWLSDDQASQKDNLAGIIDVLAALVDADKTPIVCSSDLKDEHAMGTSGGNDNLDLALSVPVDDAEECGTIDAVTVFEMSHGESSGCGALGRSQDEPCADINRTPPDGAESRDALGHDSTSDGLAFPAATLLHCSVRFPDLGRSQQGGAPGQFGGYLESQESSPL